MTESFNAIVAREEDGKLRGSLSRLSLLDLPDDDVLIAVSHSSLNYKDGLAVSGAGKICRSLPMVCGIDLAGTVLESRDPAWQQGTRVLVNGFGLSETRSGGFTQRQRLKGSLLTTIPDTFSAEEAMAIGTAGYTAMLSALALVDHGLSPGDGEVVVTGASGGVGSIAIMLLARLGYTCVASTGRLSDSESFLKSLGASRLIDRAELSRQSKPLEKEKWAAGIDSVGAETLATILAQTRYEGIVTACGLAGGTTLPSTVMPFILRGVTLRGIDSVMASQTRRQRAWTELARLIDKDLLRTLYRVEPMTNIAKFAADILAGRIRGRVVVDVNA